MGDSEEDFYKGRYFKELDARLASIEKGQGTIQKDVSDIKAKVIYMYGFAAAIGLVASIAIDYLRTHFFNVPH